MTNTRNTYNHTLTDFMVGLFSHSHCKLVNIEPLRAAKLIDDGEQATKQREAKSEFRVACVVQLKQMNQTENNSSIHVSGPNAILYENIAKYTGSKRKVVSVDLDLEN